MHNTEWVIIDTETTGFSNPIFVVEIAAQKMRGWQPVGPSFRRMLNHGTAIPPEASRVHGYTQEILERDGEAPLEVYKDFTSYVGERPVAAYNLRYDWDDVLIPEWRRLHINQCGSRGLCVLQLAQRLLDPVPAGNCKLQTLRQYYNLPARGAHTALGDVETVIDLCRGILMPLAEARGLTNWDALVRFSESTWFPSRIAFGKFKGRLFRDALTDGALYSWLEWLAASSNERSALMGRWYLEQLNVAPIENDYSIIDVTETVSTETGLVLFGQLEIEQLKAQIESARSRLADLEATYTRERHAVSITQGRLFDLLRTLFQKRDLLNLRLEYRRKYLETLLSSGEEDASAVDEEFKQANEQANNEYQRVADEFSGKKVLSNDEEAELKTLWRKLVRLFHPDRFMDDEEKLIAYQKLTAEINRARDAGDIERMREIANDPQGFIKRQGWGSISLDDSDEFDKLKHLNEALASQIITLLEAIDALHLSPEFELHELASKQPGFLDEVAKAQSRSLEEEIQHLEADLQRLEMEIHELQ